MRRFWRAEVFVRLGRKRPGKQRRTDWRKGRELRLGEKGKEEEKTDGKGNQWWVAV